MSLRSPLSSRLLSPLEGVPGRPRLRPQRSSCPSCCSGRLEHKGPQESLALQGVQEMDPEPPTSYTYPGPGTSHRDHSNPHNGPAKEFCHRFTEEKLRRGKLKLFARITQLDRGRVGLQALSLREAACHHHRKGTCPMVGTRDDVLSSFPRNSHHPEPRWGRERRREGACSAHTQPVLSVGPHKTGRPWRCVQPGAQCLVHTRPTGAASRSAARS